MKETNVSDPWIGEPEINVDDGSSFESGYDTASTLTLSGYSLTLAKNAGYWEINKSFRVYVEGRPNRLNRAMTRLLLGWEWVDV